MQVTTTSCVCTSKSQYTIFYTYFTVHTAISARQNSKSPLWICVCFAVQGPSHMHSTAPLLSCASAE